MLANLLPFIRSQGPIPASLMLGAFNAATDTLGAPERRKIADEIMQDAGRYLRHWHLTPFIKAELSDDEAMELITLRRAFVERARFLIPPLLSLIRISDEAALRSVLLRIDDCCHDFPLIKAAPHEKKLRKEAIQRLSKLKSQISAFEGVLKSVEPYVEFEFGRHMEAVSEFRNSGRSLATSYYEALREELNCLGLAADAVLYQEMRGHGGLLLTTNKVKTHIVECVYSISLQFKWPQFVTTPGSDFSIGCGLLYELACGERDASLAGAINKFARSDLRKRLDDEEKELRWENSDDRMLAYEADNFAPIKERLANLKTQQMFWEDMIASKDWNDFEKNHLTMRVLHVANQQKVVSSEYGPRLVWADQTSDHDRAESGRKMEEWDARVLKSEIEAGRWRRAKRRD